MRENDLSECVLAVKDPCVTLVSYVPSYKHDNRSHRFTPRYVLVDEMIQDIVDIMPRGCTKKVQTKPNLNHVPNPGEVVALECQMRCRLRAIVAKEAKAAVEPSTLGELVRCPNLVLGDEPRKNHALRRLPNFPGNHSNFVQSRNMVGFTLGSTRNAPNFLPQIMQLN